MKKRRERKFCEICGGPYSAMARHSLSLACVVNRIRRAPTLGGWQRCWFESTFFSKCGVPVMYWPHSVYLVDDYRVETVPYAPVWAMDLLKAARREGLPRSKAAIQLAERARVEPRPEPTQEMQAAQAQLDHTLAYATLKRR